MCPISFAFLRWPGSGWHATVGSSLVEIHDQFVNEFLVLVRLDRRVSGFRAVQFHARVHVFLRARIEFKNAVLAARLDGHVRNGHAVVHRERRRARAVELHRAIRRAVKADFADAMENDVLGHHARLQFAFEPEMHRLGHLDEQLARAHDEARVRVADAGGELVERARHAGVRIRAEQNFAGPRVALLPASAVWQTPA